MLTQEIQIDEEDRWLLERYTWIDDGQGYLRASINGKRVKLHNLLCKVDQDVEVDHKDRNRYNYRKDNLRPADHRQNCQNRGKKGGFNTSQYKGVSWLPKIKKWRAKITVNGCSVHIGVFTNEIDAAKAYNHAAKKYFQEFAALNEIP